MKKFLILLSMFALFACQKQQEVEKPENLIPQDKMVDVLVELSLLNAAKSYNLGQLQNSGLRPTQYLYSRFEIDSLQFAQSNRYYSHNIQEYEEIYTRVKEKLEGMQKEYDSIIEAKRDSLRPGAGMENRPQVLMDSLFKIRSRRPAADTVPQERD